MDLETLSIESIATQLSNLPIQENRQTTEAYHEVVIYNKDIDDWNKILSEILGPPLKAPGDPVSDKQKSITEYYGGLDDEQSLYYLQTANYSFIAMLWPWGNDENTTLKIAKI